MKTLRSPRSVLNRILSYSTATCDTMMFKNFNPNCFKLASTELRNLGNWPFLY